MSIDRFYKFQRSSKPNYVATDPITMKVMYSSNNREEYLAMKKAHREKLRLAENDE